jgi:CDP-diacylglycerol--glycerol-3-phosphate 3-phosphatidyltransferase
LDDSKSTDNDHACQTMPSRHWTFADWVKRRTRFVLDPVVCLLSRTGIHPNVLTVVGFVVASAAGTAVAAGKCSLGGWLLLISGPFDALDGALARASGHESRFGAFLDSSLDRYSEAAVLFGVLYWCSSHDNHALVLLCFVTMVGSVMVSYTRARAEGLNMACEVGVFTRMERFVVMTVMLLTEQLGIGLALLAVLTNFTAIQRIVHVYRKS